MRWPKKKEWCGQSKIHTRIWGYVLQGGYWAFDVRKHDLQLKKKKKVLARSVQTPWYMYYVFKAMDLPASVLGIIITFLPLAGRSAALSFSRVTPPDWSNL